MDKIWAPWRKEYISHKKIEGCIFCQKSKEDNDKQNYIIKRSKYSFVMLNIYPYNNGHVMIAPYRHVPGLEELREEELLDLLRLTIQSKKLINNTLKPNGYNLGINIGKFAGAGFEDHVHVHLVPRWIGDTNFMPVISDTKVIVESLDSLFKKLKNEQNNADPKRL
ncbi:HIT domain-containing protein [bacterium]|nr:HIT domain-containing protein [bacterium]